MTKKIIFNFTFIALLILPLYAFQSKNVKQISINSTKILNIDQNKQNLLDRSFSGALTDLARLNTNAKRTFTIKAVSRNKVLKANNQGIAMTSTRFASEVDASLVIERSMTEILDDVYKFQMSLIDISNQDKHTITGIISAKGVSESEKNRSLRLELLNQMVALFNISFPMENSLESKQMLDSAIKKIGNPPTASNITKSMKRNKNISLVIPTDQNNVLFTLIEKPINGDALLKGNKIFYSPNPKFVGIEEFSYLAKNEKGLISQGLVEITVINSVPVANNITINIDAGENKSIDLSKYVYDEDNDRLMYSIIQSEELNGKLTARGSKLMYSSSENFDGKEIISYYVADDLNIKSNIAKIVINVKSDKKAQADAAKKAQADAAKKAQADAAKKAQADAAKKAQAEANRKKAESSSIDLSRQQDEEEFSRQRARDELALQKAEDARRRADRELGLVGGWNIEDDSTEDSENISDSSDSEKEDKGMNLTLILGGVLLLALLAGGGGGGGGGIATGTIDIGILLP